MTQPRVTAPDLVDLFEEIAQLLDLKGENPFKIRAYTNAARAFQIYQGNLQEDVENNALVKIDGIGKAVAEKAAEYVRTGKLEYYEKLRAEFPPEIFDLFKLQGLGAKKIKLLWEKLKVESIDDLQEAIDQGLVARLDGFGSKTQENLRKAIVNNRKFSGRHRLGNVIGLARDLLEDLRTHPDVLQMSEAGSFRRRKNTVHDIDVVVATKSPASVAAFVKSHPEVQSVEVQGETKISVRLGPQNLQCDVRLVDTAAYPFALIYFTGSKEHNVALRSRARQQGWSLNEYGFTVIEGREEKAGEIPEARTEAEVYRALGLDEIPPELREDMGEIAAAEAGTLPELVKLESLRGTFHMHTTASDGRNSLEEMAAAGEELGLQYIGIADHSKGQVQANGLDADRLLAQGKMIDEFNAGHDGIHVFKGIEVDILRDGSLDLPDEVLAQMDFAVASVHSSFTIGEIAMTNRIIRALENPYVTMLGHATGRLLLSREPYPVDLNAVIDAAAETGTIIEINAHPNRLDMDWRWWPKAKAKGVKTSINPDAHNAGAISAVWFGIGVARKGWLTRDDVINTRPLEEVREILQAKRRKFGVA